MVGSARAYQEAVSLGDHRSLKVLSPKETPKLKRPSLNQPLAEAARSAGSRAPFARASGSDSAESWALAEKEARPEPAGGPRDCPSESAPSRRGGCRVPAELKFEAAVPARTVRLPACYASGGVDAMRP